MWALKLPFSNENIVSPEKKLPSLYKNIESSLNYLLLRIKLVKEFI